MKYKVTNYSASLSDDRVTAKSHKVRKKKYKSGLDKDTDVFEHKQLIDLENIKDDIEYKKSKVFPRAQRRRSRVAEIIDRIKRGKKN